MYGENTERRRKGDKMDRCMEEEGKNRKERGGRFFRIVFEVKLFMGGS
jgi:hypothetical protein